MYASLLFCKQVIEAGFYPIFNVKYSRSLVTS